MESEKIEKKEEGINKAPDTPEATDACTCEEHDHHKKEHKHKKHKSTKEEELHIKLAELNDKHIRLFAEFDNFRKRTLKEKIEFSKFASADVILSLLPVVDDFDRAIKSMEANENKELTSIKEGILLIYNKFKATLQQQGVEEMKTVGETFTTDFHEAVTNVEATSEEEKGKIVEEIQKGYLLNGKVIRFAKVIVAS